MCVEGEVLLFIVHASILFEFVFSSSACIAFIINKFKGFQKEILIFDSLMIHCPMVMRTINNILNGN